MESLTHFPQQWWSWILASSWQLSLLVILVALISLFTRRQSARFRYVLWALVLVKAFMPPTLASPWGLEKWLAQPARELARSAFGRLASENKAAMPVGSFIPVAPNDVFAGPDTSRSGAANDEGRANGRLAPRSPLAGSVSSTVSSPGRPWPLKTILFTIWLSGAVVFLGFVMLRNHQVNRLLRLARPVEEGPLRVLLERLAMGLGKSSTPDLLLSETTPSPFLFGLLRPRVVLPATLPEKLVPEELENVLLHELIHWTRRDLLVGWLQVLVQALFWFHPLVWLAGAQLNHERECACDEAVLSTGRSAAKRYGESLLQVLLAARGRSSVSFGFLGIFERNTKLQKRLEDIMSQESRIRRFGLGSWLFLLMFSLACLPMTSTGKAGSAARKPTPEKFVRVVVGEKSMTFEGQPVTTADLPARLEQVPERPVTVLEVASADDSLKFVSQSEFETMLKKKPELAKIINKADKLGFDYVSFIGVHPLGSYGVDSKYYNEKMLKTVKADCEKSPDGSGLTVQYAAIAICESAGIPYQWDKSAQLAGPEVRNFISPLHVKDLTAEQALLDLLGPMGLRFDVDQKGLYLYKGPGMNEATKGGAQPAVDEEKLLQSLTEPQRVFLAWTNRQFRKFFDNRTFANLSDKERAELENKLIETLKGPQGQDYYFAINSLGALRSRKAVGPLLGIATTPEERDCRDRWMAIRALGLIGDPAVVPQLIPLVYYPNSNTHFMAQISLVRLTGQNFGMDWQAWGKWWQAQGGQPAFSGEKITWVKSDPACNDLERIKENDRKFIEQIQGRAGQGGGGKTDEAGAPRIVSTNPKPGATDVDPALAEITVTFDRDMDTRGYSWTGGGPDFPPGIEGQRPRWLDKRTCVLPVKLEQGHYYRVGINAQSFHNFRSAQGVPVNPSAIYFTTQGAGKNLEQKVQVPRIVKMAPANQEDRVDPNLKELRVTFNVPMGPGFSWVGGGDDFPTIPEGQRPSWTADKKTCILPVQLKPNWEYRLGLNSESFKNFHSEGGVPLEPVAYTFKTGEK